MRKAFHPHHGQKSAFLFCSLLPGMESNFSILKFDEVLDFDNSGSKIKFLIGIVVGYLFFHRKSAHWKLKNDLRSIFGKVLRLRWTFQWRGQCDSFASHGHCGSWESGDLSSGNGKVGTTEMGRKCAVLWFSGPMLFTCIDVTRYVHTISYNCMCRFWGWRFFLNAWKCRGCAKLYEKCIEIEIHFLLERVLSDWDQLNKINREAQKYSRKIQHGLSWLAMSCGKGSLILARQKCPHE